MKHPSALVILFSLVVPPVTNAALLITEDMKLCIDDYAIIELGDNSTHQTNEGALDITSNSSVFGGVLKGNDTSGNELKLSTSKVTGSWDIETGVSRDGSSSFVGGKQTLSTAAFNSIADHALSASSGWASAAGSNTNFSALDGSGGLTLNGVGGVNVFHSTTDFKLTSSTALTLSGSAADYFIINVQSDQIFQVSGSAKIVLDGIQANQVLFNVLGGSDKADAQIGGSNVLFAGTLLAPGRNVLVSQTHFDTFENSGLTANVDVGDGDEAPLTAESTYQHEADIFSAFGYSGRERTGKGGGTTSGEGLFGQIIAGGKVTWSESDIALDPFCIKTPPKPPPSDPPSTQRVPDGGSTLALLSMVLIGLPGVRRFIGRA